MSNPLTTAESVALRLLHGWTPHPVNNHWIGVGYGYSEYMDPAERVLVDRLLTKTL